MNILSFKSFRSLPESKRKKLTEAVVFLDEDRLSTSDQKKVQTYLKSLESILKVYDFGLQLNHDDWKKQDDQRAKMNRISMKIIQITRSHDAVDDLVDRYEKKYIKANESDDCEDDREYRKLYQSKLKSYGVSSVGDLSDTRKKQFFDELEKEWSKEIVNTKPTIKEKYLTPGSLFPEMRGVKHRGGLDTLDRPVGGQGRSFYDAGNLYQGFEFIPPSRQEREKGRIL